MSWLQNIQNKPRATKIKIIWTVSIIIFILMIVVWVLAERMHTTASPDISLFKKIGQGIHNVKENYGK